MKASVIFTRNGVGDSIVFDAFDWETIKKAVNQWRVTEERLKKDRIIISAINPISVDDEAWIS